MAALACSQGLAQDMPAAQARYARAIATCNAGNLPRPECDACVRDAGLALDRALAGDTSNDDDDDDDDDADGTSTITTSPDGDSTIVLPADRSRPITQ